jgi:hypothetical protein
MRDALLFMLITGTVVGGRCRHRDGAGMVAKEMAMKVDRQWNAPTERIIWAVVSDDGASTIATFPFHQLKYAKALAKKETARIKRQWERELHPERFL